MAQLHAHSPQPSSQSELERRLAALKETDERIDQREIREGERDAVLFTTSIANLDFDEEVVLNLEYPERFDISCDNCDDSVEAVLRLVEDELRLDLMDIRREVQSSSNSDKGGNVESGSESENDSCDDSDSDAE